MCTERVPPCWSLLAVNRHRASPHRKARPEATTPRRPEIRVHGRKGRMGKRFAILIGVAAAGVMALGAQKTAAVPALASHTVKIDSMVTLPPPQKRPFYGRVKSNKHACEVHRLVKVYRVRPGRDHVADRGDAKDRTNQRGKWRDRQLILGEGDFYAKVVRRKEGTAGTTFVCRQDRSPIRHVEHQG